MDLDGLTLPSRPAHSSPLPSNQLDKLVVSEEESPTHKEKTIHTTPITQSTPPSLPGQEIPLEEFPVAARVSFNVGEGYWHGNCILG